MLFITTVLILAIVVIVVLAFLAQRLLNDNEPAIITLIAAAT